jgi:hypothetical protein
LSNLPAACSRSFRKTKLRPASAGLEWIQQHQRAALADRFPGSGSPPRAPDKLGRHRGARTVAHPLCERHVCPVVVAQAAHVLKVTGVGVGRDGALPHHCRQDVAAEVDGGRKLAGQQLQQDLVCVCVCVCVCVSCTLGTRGKCFLNIVHANGPR